MKAIMLAARYLTEAVGNIIDVVVIAALEGVFSSQVKCFRNFLFSFSLNASRKRIEIPFLSKWI